MAKKNQLYFRREDDECCYGLKYQLERARDEGLSEVTLFTAEKEKIEGVFYCHAVGECGEEGTCGKQCDDYAPKNGKSGMCKHKGMTYAPAEEVTFKIL
jgi:hypothetical protein